MRFASVKVLSAFVAAVVWLGSGSAAQAQGPSVVLTGSGVTTTSTASYSTSARILISFYPDRIRMFVVGPRGGAQKAGTPVIDTGSGGWSVIAQSDSAITWRLTRSVGFDGFWLKVNAGGFTTVQVLDLDPGAKVTLDVVRRTVTIKGTISRPYKTKVSCTLRF